jgi:ribosomal protein L37E
MIGIARGLKIRCVAGGRVEGTVLRKLIKDCGLGDSIKIKNFDWADFILDA